MKKNFFLASILMLLTSFLFSQDYDFKIPDIELETTQPTVYDLQTGNYAVKLLKIDLFEQQIESILEGMVNAFIIDTGIDSDHPFLKSIIETKYAKSFVPGETWEDGNSHGTHVAGDAFGYSSHYNLGSAQILNKHGKVRIIPLKGLKNNGFGNYEWVRQAIWYARETAPKLDGFNMIIMSLGGAGDYDALKDEIQAARDDGFLVIVAAGNTGGTPVQVPARYKGANAVAATNKDLERAYYSSYGKEIYAAAPGTGILNCIPGGGTGKKTGTSMAGPILAGQFALLASMYPDATANQLEQMIAKNTTDILPEGRDELTGFGVVIFDLWIFSDPTLLPDEPLGWLDEPVGEPELHREKRTLTFQYTDLETWWKNMADKYLKKLHFDVVISVETTLYDEVINDKITQAVVWYENGGNRAVVMGPEHGYVDATYYAGGHFLEMMGNRKFDLNYKVVSITGYDDKGRVCYVDGKKVKTKGLRALFRRAITNQPYTFTFKNK